MYSQGEVFQDKVVDDDGDDDDGDVLCAQHECCIEIRDTMIIQRKPQKIKLNIPFEETMEEIILPLRAQVLTVSCPHSQNAHHSASAAPSLGLCQII